MLPWLVNAGGHLDVAMVSERRGTLVCCHGE